VLWGFLYAAGLRTEEALALRWSDVLGLSRAGCTLKIDRVFTSGQIRNTTKTGRGRDVPVIAPLAQDVVDLFEAGVEGVDLGAREAEPPTDGADEVVDLAVDVRLLAARVLDCQHEDVALRLPARLVTGI
jgi:hypothetical protein